MSRLSFHIWKVKLVLVVLVVLVVVCCVLWCAALCTMRPRIPNSITNTHHQAFYFCCPNPAPFYLPPPLILARHGLGAGDRAGRLTGPNHGPHPPMLPSLHTTPSRLSSSHIASHLKSPTHPARSPTFTHPPTTHTPVPTQTRRNPRSPTHLRRGLHAHRPLAILLRSRRAQDLHIRVLPHWRPVGMLRRRRLVGGCVSSVRGQQAVL